VSRQETDRSILIVPLTTLYRYTLPKPRPTPDPRPSHLHALHQPVRLERRDQDELVGRHAGAHAVAGLVDGAAVLWVGGGRRAGCVVWVGGASQSGWCAEVGMSPQTQQRH